MATSASRIASPTSSSPSRRFACWPCTTTCATSAGVTGSDTASTVAQNVRRGSSQPGDARAQGDTEARASVSESPHTAPVRRTRDRRRLDRSRARRARSHRPDRRGGGREPEPVRGQRRPAGHRQAFRFVPDDPRPDRRRLLARARVLGAVAGRPRRPLRAQVDAPHRNGVGDPDVSARRVRTLRHRPLPRTARRGLGRRDGLPDHAGADHRSVGGARPYEVDRTVVGARRRDRHAWTTLLRLSSGALLLGIGVPDHAAAGGRRARARVAVRPCTRERVHGGGRQPRRDPLARPGRCSDSRDQLCTGPEQGHADPRARGHRGAGARRVLPPSTPRGEPALRPGRRLPPRLLGGGLRRGDRVRLADGRGVREPAVPPERPRLLDAPGGRSDPAGRGVHGARRTALRQARRGTRRPLHAAVRLRVPLPGLHHDAAPLEGGQLRTGRSRSPTSSSASVSGSRVRPHRIRSRALCRSVVPEWPRAPPTSSATSAGRSCSRSSGRCSPRATRPPRGR